MDYGITHNYGNLPQLSEACRKFLIPEILRLAARRRLDGVIQS
jgi:hypothetical protein